MSIDTSWLGDQFGSLDKIELLASGGQKWTFACIHEVHGDCVLKVVKPGQEGRIDRELEAVQRIPEGPSVPPLYEAGQLQSQMGPIIWTIEARIPGRTLEDMLQDGPLGEERLLSLARDLLQVAVAAENASVVHRDIKPANIIVDEEGRAWLLDFGITRILDLESRTRTDAFMGPHSPGYGAPEQFRNRKSEIDGRTDLFGIGVVLYESASGSNPFLSGASDHSEVLQRTETLELPPLDLDWDHDGQFADFVLSLVQKYPYKRPKSCQFALEWLEELIEEFEAD